MKQKYLILFLAFGLFCTAAAAQTVGSCDGDRFINEVFTEVEISTIQYGENVNYGVTEALIMDVYEPEGDTAAARPVAIFAHGGGFIFGSRTEMDYLCTEYTKRGYVAATIDYRKLQVAGLDSVNAAEGLIRCMQDMKAAVRYFRNDAITANTYRVDTNFIFVGGYSAGAIAALHTAYWDAEVMAPEYIEQLLIAEGGLEGQSSDFMNVSSSVQGVINLSGGLIDADWVEADGPPLASYHGTDDGTVFINTGLAAGALLLEGSEVIHARADEVGLKDYFYILEGGGHDGIFEVGPFAEDYNTFLEETWMFQESILCSEVSSVGESLAQPVFATLAPNPVQGQLFVENTTGETLELQLFSAAGALVWEGLITSYNESINLSHLSSGIYFYRLRTQSRKGSQQGKLVVAPR
jgi:hypothetical protein